MRTPSPGRRTSLLFVIVSVVAAACGSPPAPSAPVASSLAAPSPSASAAAASPRPASPSAGPSTQPSTRLDVVEAFRSKMASVRSFEATIDGMVTVGENMVPVGGTLQVSGSDSHQVLTMMPGGEPRTTETIKVDGTTYTRRGDAWFAAAPSSTGTGGIDDAFVKAMTGLTDVGTVSKDGQTFHRLTPPPGTTLLLSSFGAATAGSADGPMTIEFYAKDDGTPAGIGIDGTWTQKVDKVDQTASMHLDFALDTAKTMTIDKPSPIWVTGKSKRLGYAVAYPAEWDVELARKTSGGDYYYGLNGEGFAVTRTAKCKCTLNATAIEVIRYERQHVKGFKVVRNSTARVAGLRARVIESRGTYDGARSWDLTYLVVRGKYLYVFDYSAPHPLKAADRAIAQQLVGSVAFR
jgi:hypothetical protein